MSKALMLVAGCAAILSTAALAQSMRGPGDDRPRPDGYRSERGETRGEAGNSWRDGSREGWRDEREGGWGRERWRGGERRGAGFMLRNGNASIAMRCGDEALPACVDAAVKLLDRARAGQTQPPNAPVPQ